VSKDTRSADNMKVIYQPESFRSGGLFEIISATKERVECCMDYRGLSFLAADKSLWNTITGLIDKGIKSRFVTEITQDNTQYCNRLMKYSNQVLHDDSVKGNFLIVDGIKYLCYVIEGGQIKPVLYNEVKPFVETQQYLFDNLCDKAIPAKEKIREIGRGIRGNFIDTIRNPSEIQKIAVDILDSATYEILLLFSTINSFYRAEYGGILNSLWQASERGVMIKILIQAEDDNQLRETIQKRIRQKRLPINVQYITKPLQSKIATLVIDQAVSLAIEVNDDAKKTFDESIGLAIYSNNESTVSSCISIFETLWIQSEFDKQNKVKQAYFQMFKGLELKDEFYDRRWSFEQTKKKKENTPIE
jgi:two-component system, OmpR family, sensor histidine kinase VicK